MCCCREGQTFSFPLQALSLDRKLKQLYLVSVAQFRPEKNHSMQLRAFALARQLAMASAPSKAGEPKASACADTRQRKSYSPSSNCRTTSRLSVYAIPDEQVTKCWEPA